MNAVDTWTEQLHMTLCGNSCVNTVAHFLWSLRTVPLRTGFLLYASEWEWIIVVFGFAITYFAELPRVFYFQVYCSWTGICGAYLLYQGAVIVFYCPGALLDVLPKLCRLSVDNGKLPHDCWTIWRNYLRVAPAFFPYSLDKLFVLFCHLAEC